MYSWLRDGLIPGASALLESLWAYAWISFFLAVGETTSGIRYPYPWILGLILLPALFGRVLDRSAWGPRRVRQHGVTAMVVILFAGFMIPFHAAGAAWLVAATLLARGVWLGLHDVGSDSGAGWFIGGFAGFLALLAIGLVAHPASWEPDRAQLGPLLFLYLFGGVSWLALVRRQEQEETAFRRAASQVNGTWLLLLTGISAVMIAMVALASFGGGGVLRGLLAIAVALIGLIWRAAMFVVVNWLGPAVVWLFQHLPAGSGGFRLGGLFGGRRPPSNLDARILAWLRVHLPVEWLLAVTGSMRFALLAIWLACRFVKRDPGADDEERSSLWSWRLFLSQLRQALRGLRRSLRPSGARAPAGAHEAPPPSSVRQLYAAALRWCRERDRPRRPGDTPLEFEPVLDDETGGALARDLTQAYVLARYAEREPAEPEVDALSQRWEHVRRSEEAEALT